jgi:hypothetical protein
MKSRSSFIRPAGGALAIAAAFALFRSDEKQIHTPDRARTEVKVDRSIEMLQGELAELRRELDAMKLERERPIARAETPAEDRAPPSAPVRTDTDRETSFAAKIEATEQRADDAIHELDFQLASETRDVAWSEELEGELRRLVELEPATRLIALECQATVCRAELLHPDHAARDRFGESVLSSRKVVGPGLVRTFIAGDGAPGTLMYLRREGYAIPGGRS